MRRLFNVIRQTAQSEATVLIQGESGTGKELVAHAIHQLSNRSRGPFIAVNCAALSPNLLESELFGHERGAFTGAVARRRGRFELADGGTLFLDEISETDATIQVKLLRVLEERAFERVGGDTIEVDLRLIVATNADLKALVREGTFREDLFFRLDVVNIDLPPLRERKDDIPLLCDWFIREFNKKNNRTIEGITSDAVSMFMSYSWPGNVRELRNTIEKMAVLTRGTKLSARDIPGTIRSAAANGLALDNGEPVSAGRNGSMDSLAATEKRMIMAALRKHNNNRTQAAAELGISRRTLHRKLKRYQEEG
jgi:DNA-binding NtrC family response regulator